MEFRISIKVKMMLAQSFFLGGLNKNNSLHLPTFASQGEQKILTHQGDAIKL